MGLEEVKKEILKQAETQAEQRLEEANERADEILDEAEEEADSVREDILEDAREEADQKKRQKIAAARMEAKNQRLAAKQDVMDEAYSRLEERIRSLPKDEKLELIESVLDRLSAEHDIGRVIVPSGFRSAVSEMTDADVETGDIDDGVVVEDSSGDLSFDYTFSTVLETIRNERRQELAGHLF